MEGSDHSLDQVDSGESGKGAIFWLDNMHMPHFTECENTTDSIYIVYL